MDDGGVVAPATETMSGSDAAVVAVNEVVTLDPARLSAGLGGDMS
jgi:hypothetical protein